MITLPDKALLRVGEVADYYGVSDRAVYLWIEHGHLEVEHTPAGQMRVTRESLDKCRFSPRPQKEL
jgi:excisionase family DNA binding protein